MCSSILTNQVLHDALDQIYQVFQFCLIFLYQFIINEMIINLTISRRV